MISCKNCATEYEGKYCPQCGQKAKVKRITTKQVLEDVRQSLFHYDSGFFHTVWQLVRRPGHTVREYLQGKRAANVKPIKFLLWASALNFLVFHLLGLDEQISKEMAQGQKQAAFMAKTMQYLFDHPVLIMLMIMPGLAFASWWLFRRNGQYNFAENFVLNSYLMGAVSMFGLVTSPLTKLMGEGKEWFWWKFMLSFGVMVAYLTWGYVQFFQPRQKWLAGVKTLLSLGISYVFIILVVSLAVLLVAIFFRDWFLQAIQG